MNEGTDTERSAQYPKRPRFFSHRFTRLIARICLANEIGPEACWLLAVIVNTEDAKGYRGGVTYFNGQLINVSGFGSVSSLDRFRAKAIKAGWLYYKPGLRSRAGVYWVTIPPHFENVKDGPIDHDQTEYAHAPMEGNNSEPTHGRKESAQETGRKVLRQPEGKCSPIFPSPNPKTLIQTHPSLEDVTAYFAARNNGLDPEEFFAHYEANGWKQSSGRPIKKWQAAVITWEKNAVKFGRKTAPKPEPIKQHVLSDYEIAHGTRDANGFTYNTRLCRDPKCPDCLPKRGGNDA